MCTGPLSDAESNASIYFHGTPTLSIDTAEAWQGTHGLKVTTQGGGNQYEQVGCYLPVSSFQPGATYTFSAYLFSGSAGSTLRIYWQGDDGYPTNNNVGAVNTYTLAAGWQRFVITATMPNPIPFRHTTGMRFDTGGTAQAIVFWLDGFQCETGSTAHTWIEGNTQAGPYLVRQGLVQIYDSNNTNIFTGYVAKLNDMSQYPQSFVEIECYDYWQDLDRVVVNEVYVNESDTYIIRNLLQKYAPWIDRSLIPTTNQFTFTIKRFKQYSLQKAIQAVADTVAYEVYITPDAKFYYAAPHTATTAPFGFTDSLEPLDFRAWVNYKVDQYTQDDNAVVNRVFYYGGQRLVGDYTQDCSGQCDGKSKVFLLAYAPEKASDGAIHVTINGSDISTGYEGIDTLISQGGSYQAIVNTVSKVVQLDTAYPAGTIASVRYRYKVPLILTLTDQGSYQYFGRYYDATLADDSIYDISTAT
jgi:hypothetical protein